MPDGFAFTHNLDALSRWSKAFYAGIDRAERQAITTLATRAEKLARKAFKDPDDASPKDPQNDRGHLRVSITHRVRKAGDGRWEGIVGSNLAYARAVEFGRPPGRFPPPDAILGWVRRKLAAKNADLKDPALARRVAFLIGKKIHDRGIPPRPFLTPAYRQILPQILPTVQAAIAQAAANAAIGVRGGN